MSKWFMLVRRYIEATGSQWFILSDKHGLVTPNQMLAPYEQSLKDMTVADRRAWAHRVQAQMDSRLPSVERIVVFAGQHYREFLMEYLRRRSAVVEVPLEGLRNGEQLH